MGLPLEGIRVLDVSRGVAASYCTLVLADYGAEVIKIESPLGDTIRFNPPLTHGMGSSFISLNRNKKSVVLNLELAEEREKFLELARSADVVTENFRPGVMEKLGVGYEALAALNPRLILCSVTSFGPDGAWRGKPAHDNNLVALSGMLSGITPENSPPPLPVCLLAGIVGGSLWAVIGILLALEERRRTGRGRRVDVSMLQGLLAVMAPELVTELVSGEEQKPGQAWNSGPLPNYNLYRTKDGRYMTLAAIEPKFWQNFCRLFGREDLLEHGFTSPENREAIKKEIAAIIGSHTQEELLRLASKTDILLEPVLTPREALALPPVKAAATVYHLKDEQGRSFPQIKMPLDFGNSTAPTPPPEKGEHNRIYLSPNGDKK